MNECIICGKPNSHNHHIVFRKECKPLENCKKNQIRLCYEHHQGTFGVHGKNGDKLNKKFKREFQNWLEKRFIEDRYTLEEIQKKLGISSNAARSLSKLMWMDTGVRYKREDIIRTCMGGMLYAN